MAERSSQNDVHIEARPWRKNNPPHTIRTVLFVDGVRYYLNPEEARRIADQLHDSADSTDTQTIPGEEAA